MVELLNFLAPLFILSSLVVAQVFEEDLRGELRERSSEDVRLELEELVDNVLVLDRVENVSGQGDHILQRFVQVVTLKSQLEFADILASDAFIIQREKFGANCHRIDVFEAHGEEHLAVTVKLFQHVRVAVFEDQEELLDTLKDQLFRLRWVYPFSQVIEQVFFKHLSIFLSTQFCVNGTHSRRIR